MGTRQAWHGNWVMISPAEFIPILEESGLIIPVGRWLIRTAVGVCKEWQKEHPGMRVQVNLSYVQVAKTDVLRDVREVLHETGLSPECLGVELTESGYLEPQPFPRRYGRPERSWGQGPSG